MLKIEKKEIAKALNIYVEWVYRFIQKKGERKNVEVRENLLNLAGDLIVLKNIVKEKISGITYIDYIKEALREILKNKTDEDIKNLIKNPSSVLVDVYNFVLEKTKSEIIARQARDNFVKEICTLEMYVLIDEVLKDSKTDFLLQISYRF